MSAQIIAVAGRESERCRRLTGQWKVMLREGTAKVHTSLSEKLVRPRVVPTVRCDCDERVRSDCVVVDLTKTL